LHEIVNNNKKNNNIPFQSNDKLFYIFHIHIKYVWEYFLSTSFTPTFFYENCKAVNIKKSENSLNEKLVLELHFLEKKFSIKTIIEDIVDKEYFKSFTHKSIEVPENISHFSLKISLFFCSVHKTTGLYVSVNFLDETKDKFIYDYLVENHHKVCRNIEQFIENNFKEYEQSESICIEKSSDIVWNYLISNNYYNLKILLGNNASVKATNIPNEIEVEHFTKNNKMRMVVTKVIEFNEKNLFLQVVSSTVPIPKQNISIKIISINNNSCLVFFTHNIKQFLYCNSINSYSIIKQKTLWLLKSTIEENINTSNIK
jgi:hypothetical protein